MADPEIPTAAIHAASAVLWKHHGGVSTEFTDEAREVLAAALPHVYRDFADLIDRGPAFPLPPSIYSALARERADDLTEDGDHG